MKKVLPVGRRSRHRKKRHRLRKLMLTSVLLKGRASTPRRIQANETKRIAFLLG